MAGFQSGLKAQSGPIQGHMGPRDGKAEEEMEPLVLRQLERPHWPSCFLPGKVEKVPVQILVDTGCTTNLLSKKVFDRLARGTRATLEPYDSHGVMADGTRMSFYGLIRLPINIRHFSAEETFVVGQADEDVILGMPFLTHQDCAMDFKRQTLVLQKKELKCTDRLGRALVSTVQVYKAVEVPPRHEVVVTGRVTDRAARLPGIIEGQAEGTELMIAASLVEPDDKGRVLLRCINPSDQPLELKAGSVVGEWTAVAEEDVQSAGVEKEEIKKVQIIPGKGKKVPQHLQELFVEASQDLGQDQKDKVEGLLWQYQDVFSRGDHDIGLTQLVQHEIPTLPGTGPIKQPPHRLGPEKELEVQRQVDSLLKRGLIEPAGGAWSSPVVLVRKKDGSWRFCVDYRRVNAVTQYDAYPLPRIDESLDALAGSKYFSTLDLVSGYWQVPLTEDAKEKSAFVTRNGLWRWKVLPFGLTSAPATFQRLMEKVLHGLHWKTLLLYLDDIIVIAPDFQTHIERLGEVFHRLKEAGLKLKPSKCELFKQEVRYLGHVVSAHGVSTDPEKVKAVREWPVPETVKEVQSFLGMAGYYRQYMPDFSTVAKPLSHLSNKDVTWCWGPECQEAFEEIKRRLTQAPILGYPDPRLTYILDTDASATGVGAVLSQAQKGKERVISYYSKTLDAAQRNYCVTRRELLAVIKAITFFRPYLYGREFVLRTDHTSLMWLC